MIFLAAVGAGLALVGGVNFLYAVAAYFAVNILYSLYLKHLSLIDISLIAFGFVLRVIAGGIAADVPVSKWLILMTFLLACCLALGKRRDDLLLDVDKEALRPSLSGYTLPFIDTCLVVLSVTTLVCYIMYTVSDEVVHRSSFGQYLSDLCICDNRHLAFFTDSDRRSKIRFTHAYTLKRYDDPGDDRIVAVCVSGDHLCLVSWSQIGATTLSLKQISSEAANVCDVRDICPQQ